MASNSQGRPLLSQSSSRAPATWFQPSVPPPAPFFPHANGGSYQNRGGSNAYPRSIHNASHHLSHLNHNHNAHTAPQHLSINNNNHAAFNNSAMFAQKQHLPASSLAYTPHHANNNNSNRSFQHNHHNNNNNRSFQHNNNNNNNSNYIKQRGGQRTNDGVWFPASALEDPWKRLEARMIVGGSQTCCSGGGGGSSQETHVSSTSCGATDIGKSVVANIDGSESNDSSNNSNNNSSSISNGSSSSNRDNGSNSESSSSDRILANELGSGDLQVPSNVSSEDLSTLIHVQHVPRLLAGVSVCHSSCSSVPAPPLTPTPRSASSTALSLERALMKKGPNMYDLLSGFQ